MKRHILNIVGFLTILFIIIFALNRIFIPKWIEEAEAEKSRYDSFYALEKNSLQYLTLGASTSYFSVNPMQIYAETGLHGYALGEAQQNLEISYYWLKEVLKYQKPQYLFMDISGLFYDESRNTKTSWLLSQIGSMKFSVNKLNAIYNCAPDNDVKMGLLFPIYQYHNRWDELKANDFEYAFSHHYYINKGARLDIGSVLWTNIGKRDNVTEIIYNKNTKSETKIMKISSENKEKFDLIYQECMKNNIILVPTKFPSITDWNNDSKELANDFLKKYGLYVLDLNKEVTNIIWENDTADSGYHTNFMGSAKTSSYLGKWLEARINESEEASSLWENDRIEYISYEENKLLNYREKTLNFLNNLGQDMENKLIIVAVCDEASDGWNDLLQERINTLNLCSNFYNNTQNSYIGIVDRGESIFENWSENTIVYDDIFYDMKNVKHSIYVKSGGYVSSCSAQIEIDEGQYAINGRGLNIVVYDYLENRVISSIVIDTHNKNWEITTKFEGKVKDSPLIENGTYSFLSAINESYGLMKDDTSVLNISTRKHDLFELEYVGKGLYLIKAKGEDKYLTVENWGNTNGTRFSFEKYTGLSSQKWFIREHTDNTYSIHSFYNKKCIDIPDGNMIEGNQLQLYEENCDYPQRFILRNIKY